jgi:DNA polymerase III alpha subunit (gram-positive type)
MKTILVFDVETTGLLPKNPTPGEIPYVIQFSFVLYDMETSSIIQKYNEYIKPPDNVVIKPIITELTGITRELLDEKGVDITEALETFQNAYVKTDLLVAHNIEFDRKMLILEAQMNYPFLIHTMRSCLKEEYCTMIHGIDVCKIQRFNSRGPYFKHPKLIELYRNLFNVDQVGLHDALIDVMCCLRCFLKLKFQQTIPQEVFDEWL